MDNKVFLGKYRVVAEKIEGGKELTGSPLAYAGEEIDSGRKVGVEVVSAARLKMVVRDQLEAEAVAARNLNHVNIPALYDFGIQDDNLVYVSEDLEGTLAEEWVRLHGPMPVGPVLRIASQVVSALGAAAFHRIVHRAINPTNLVLVPGQTEAGEWPLVKLLHFVGGAPKFSGTDVSAVAFDNKSLPYASPEQLQHGFVDFRSEIYSLGGTMWFLLTGRPPPMAAQPTNPGLVVDRINAMPKKVERLLAQMLSANPAERPHDPLAFYRQLQDCLTEVERRETTLRAPEVPVRRTVRIGMPTRRPFPLKALALAALFLASVAVAALLLREYLLQRRIVRAEEPIGLPVVITDAFPAATPASARPADTMVSIVRQPTPSVADANSMQSAPVRSEQSKYADTRPEVIDSSKVASTSQVEIGPGSTQSPEGKVSAGARQTTPKKIIMHEVRRAQPVEGRHVKPAKPTPRGEIPPDVAPGTAASPRQETNAAAQTPAETRSRKTKRVDSEPAILLKVPR